MDYEKKYNEALERAKQFMSEHPTRAEADLMVALFPELKESEDERIREWLVDYFKAVGKSWIHRDISPKQIIAYLEKQKELPFVKDVILGYPGLYFYDGERMHFQGNPAMEEKQKEQKPNIELIQRSWYREGYNDRKFGKEPKWIIKTGEGGPKYEENPKYGQMLEAEQKPAEWSDKLDIDTLRDWSMRFAPDIREEIEATAYHFYNLRPQPHTVSVENATKFGNLEYERGVKDGIQHSENHRWKPSEEQMEALEYVIRDYREDSCNATANYLQEILDHLKNM